jgi:Flp pilus assembly protein TadG
MAAGESGVALVELALMIPMALVVFTGLLQVGVYVNNTLELQNATSLAGEYLSVSRQPAGTAWDPCAVTLSAFKQVAPFLNASNVTFTFAFQPKGAASATTYTGTSCTAGASLVSQQGTAQVSTSYPCSLAIYGKHLIPGCTLSAQVTEVIQ